MRTPEILISCFSLSWVSPPPRRRICRLGGKPHISKHRISSEPRRVDGAAKNVMSFCVSRVSRNTTFLYFCPHPRSATSSFSWLGVRVDTCFHSVSPEYGVFFLVSVVIIYGETPYVLPLCGRCGSLLWSRPTVLFVGRLLLRYTTLPKTRCCQEVTRPKRHISTCGID